MKHNLMQKMSANALLFTVFMGLILVPVATLGIVNNDEASQTQVLSATDSTIDSPTDKEYEEIILELKQQLKMCRESSNSFTE